MQAVDGNDDYVAGRLGVCRVYHHRGRQQHRQDRIARRCRHGSSVMEPPCWRWDVRIRLRRRVWTALAQAATNSAMSADDPLEKLRQQIDQLDDQIIALLNDRARVVVDVGRLKQTKGGPIYAPDREKA